jgi:hypothetical protein
LFEYRAPKIGAEYLIGAYSVKPPNGASFKGGIGCLRTGQMKSYSARWEIEVWRGEGCGQYGTWKPWCTGTEHEESRESTEVRVLAF